MCLGNLLGIVCFSAFAQPAQRGGAGLRAHLHGAVQALGLGLPSPEVADAFVLTFAEVGAAEGAPYAAGFLAGDLISNLVFLAQ